jgi:trigger factor
MKAGDTKEFTITLPKDHLNKDFAGKRAHFKVTAKKVELAHGISEIDETLLQQLGLKSFEEFDELIKGKLSLDYENIARLQLKKDLFDKIEDVLNSTYKDFTAPRNMVEEDFKIVWEGILKQMKQSPEKFTGKTESEIKAEYKAISERRVKLGILLAEIARVHHLEVLESELQQAVYNEALQHPGQEKIILAFYSDHKNLERLRGPLLEEKAVDWILTQIETTTKEVSSKEFFEKYGESFKELYRPNTPKLQAAEDE